LREGREHIIFVHGLVRAFGALLGRTGRAIDEKARSTDERAGARKAHRAQRVPDSGSRMRSLKRISARRTRTAPGPATDDQILLRLRAALNELYGDRIERVVLFGSRARGDAHEASDYDIAVFLNDLTDRWGEFRRLADLRTEILADTGAFIEARPFRAGGYRERTPLMHEIRREGIDF
jgi:predicted nucleotidyltransferase